MRVMLKRNGKEDTGPLLFSDYDKVTLSVEAGALHGSHWYIDITVGMWNGLPRIERVVTKDAVDG